MAAGGVFSTALHGIDAARIGQVRLSHRLLSPLSGAEPRDTGTPRSFPEQV